MKVFSRYKKVVGLFTCQSILQQIEDGFVFLQYKVTVFILMKKTPEKQGLRSEG